MSTQTSSRNRTTQNNQRDPLRWLIPAALLLLFLAICCVGQVVIVFLSPRDQASNLNLLSKKIADYRPWLVNLQLPPIARPPPRWRRPAPRRKAPPPSQPKM